MSHDAIVGIVLALGCGLCGGWWIKNFAHIKLRQPVLFDDKTGLATRKSMVRWLSNRQRHPVRRRRGYMVLFCDIDNFGDFNKIYGHEAGDSLLEGLAYVFATAARDVARRYGIDDLVICRYGGDEFAVAAAGVASSDVAVAFAQQLEQSCTSDPYKITNSKQPLAIGVTIGVVWEPRLPNDPVTMLDDASSVMIWAKRQAGQQVVLLTPDIDKAISSGRALLDQARAAALARDYELVFQPIFRLSGGRYQPKLYEVLVRLLDPDGRPIDTAAAFKTLENHGVTGQIGLQVLEEIGGLYQQWIQSGWSDKLPVMSINFSATLPQNPRLVGRFFEVLDTLDRRIVGRLLGEWTEVSKLRDVENTHWLLREGRKRGMGWILDDFGADYANYDILSNFETLDWLKVSSTMLPCSSNCPSNDDMVMEAWKQERCLARLVSVLRLDFQYQMVLEGIETEALLGQVRQAMEPEHWERLYLQGNYLSPPLTLSQLEISLFGRTVST